MFKQFICHLYQHVRLHIWVLKYSFVPCGTFSWKFTRVPTSPKPPQGYVQENGHCYVVYTVALDISCLDLCPVGEEEM